MVMSPCVLAVAHSTMLSVLMIADNACCLCCCCVAAFCLMPHLLSCAVCEASNSEWQQASSSCICSAGYVPAIGTSYALGNLTCEPCAAGTAAAANEAVCAACGGNTYSAAAAGACVNCPGSTVANTGHTACECPAGYAPAGELLIMDL